MVDVNTAFDRVCFDATHDEGWTAMHLACYQDLPDVVRQLLEAGADPTMRTTDGRTALDIAVGNQHEDCVRVLQVR
eukprot:56000-Eustigmatos_ZCMA.PRE.1